MSCSLFVATAPLILRRLRAEALRRASVVAAYIRVRLTPQDFAGLRVAASAKAGAPCICLPAEASAQAGAFLSTLRKMTFSR